MSFNFKSNSITTASGKIIFEESGHQTQLRNGKIIITDKFISVDTYVFLKNTPIPMCYPALVSGWAKYDVSTAKSEVSPSGNSVVNAEYSAGLAKILKDTSIKRSYTVSACQSNIHNSNTAASTENTYFVKNQKFNSSAYSASVSAPTIIANNEAVPYTLNLKFTVTQSGNTLTFTNKALDHHIYASLLVTLL